MLGDFPLLAVLTAVLVANVAVALLVSRRLADGPDPDDHPLSGRAWGPDDREPATDRRDRSGDGTGNEAAGSRARGPDGRVRCSNCGAGNAPEYRFCRRCVAELPKSGAAPGGPGTPLRRETN